MKTRSQTSAARAQAPAARAPVVKAAAEKEDDTELCSICYEPLASRKSVIIHKGAKWHHTLHVDCRDKWVKTCKQNNTHATCPLCPSFRIMEQTIYIKRALAHLETINRHDGNLPFMGIMIYMGGSCVLKLTNLDFCDPTTNMPFTSNIPLSVIYKATRDMGPNVCRKMGIFSTKNMSHNIKPMNWLKWKYPSLRVKNTYFTVPPKGIATNINDYIRTHRTMGDVYVDYIAYIYAIYDTILQTDDAYEDINNVCKRITRTNMGGDTHTEGYESPENPHFPQEHRALADRPKSTHVPMAWIAIDTEYE
jgi:hypothetical protein